MMNSNSDTRFDPQWWVVLAIVGALGLLLAAGWTVRDQFLPVEVGSRAPSFEARDLDGNPVDVADLRGEVVLLNVWATWCPPCLEEMPSMQRLHETLGQEGLRIVAVSIDADGSGRDRAGRPGGNVAGFAESLGLGFDIWHDPAGRIQRVYSTVGVPESFIIDREGRIVRKVVGAVEWDDDHFVQYFERLLNE